MLHHAAAEAAAPEDVHRWHLSQGWAGIGYHLYVRKDGSVHAGRPLWATGAQVANHNSHTLGVCCEGDYSVETAMPAAQLTALREALAYLKTHYPAAAVKCHRDYGGTVCPGQYFPLAAATAGLPQSASLTAPSEREPAPAGSTNETVGEGLAPPAMTEEDQEEEDMKRYNTVSELPEAYRADVQTLIDRGYLRGKGEDALDLTEDMARVLVICARMEGIA